MGSEKKFYVFWFNISGKSNFAKTQNLFKSLLQINNVDNNNDNNFG